MRNASDSGARARPQSKPTQWDVQTASFSQWSAALSPGGVVSGRSRNLLGKSLVFSCDSWVLGFSGFSGTVEEVPSFFLFSIQLPDRWDVASLDQFQAWLHLKSSRSAPLSGSVYFVPSPPPALMAADNALPSCPHLALSTREKRKKKEAATVHSVLDRQAEARHKSDCFV